MLFRSGDYPGLPSKWKLYLEYVLSYEEPACPKCGEELDYEQDQIYRFFGEGDTLVEALESGLPLAKEFLRSLGHKIDF